LGKKFESSFRFKIKGTQWTFVPFFEALKYEKKIITDNPHVKNYDFYRKENIFIIGEDSENELKNFIEALLGNS
jgi:hypothetical protein